MNGFSIIIFAALAVISAAMFGLILVDILFKLHRHSWAGLIGGLLLAAVFGWGAMFFGSGALKMAAAAIAGAAI
ncbi:MAG: hypothetical protein WC114_01535 [Smithellaceae bacterium]